MRRTKHEPLGYEYSRHSQNFFDTLEAYDIDTSITLPELSPRATNLDKDPQIMKEKNLVFDFITETGQLQRYAMDKAVVPVVYGDVFLSENNRRNTYVRCTLKIRDVMVIERHTVRGLKPSLETNASSATSWEIDIVSIALSKEINISLSVMKGKWRKNQTNDTCKLQNRAIKKQQPYCERPEFHLTNLDFANNEVE